MAVVRRPADRITRVVLWAFVVVSFAPGVVHFATHGFSIHRRSGARLSTGLVVAVVIFVFGVLVALVVALLRRHRWAWWTFVVLDGFGLVLAIPKWHGVLIFLEDLAIFVLLVSPPMRRYVARDEATETRSDGQPPLPDLSHSTRPA